MNVEQMNCDLGPGVEVGIRKLEKPHRNCIPVMW